MSKVNIAVVIAALNEENSIANVVRAIPRECLRGNPVTVVVVDDGSSDRTARVAQKEDAIVLRHLINRGQGAALKTGFDYATQNGFDVIVSFDADGQHKATEIERLVQTLIEKDLDVVLGSRFLSQKAVNMPVSRKLVLKAGVLFTHLLSRIKVTDTHNGFRAFRAGAFQKLKLVQDRMEHASEIIDQISKHRLRYQEVPVTIEYNDYSKVKGQRNSNAVRIALVMILHKLTK